MRRLYAAAKIIAVLLIAALCFSWGRRSGLDYAARLPGVAYDQPWEDMDPAQLSWVAEGIQERISELEDKLAHVRELQRDEMAGR